MHSGVTARTGFVTDIIRLEVISPLRLLLLPLDWETHSFVYLLWNEREIVILCLIVLQALLSIEEVHLLEVILWLLQLRLDE